MVLLSQNILATQISYKVDNKTFKEGHEVYLKASQKLKLRFDVKNVKRITWYQIIPDTSKFYKNANHPWEKNPYKWIGYGSIDYKKVEIKAFENKREVELTSEILKKNKPRYNPYYNTKLGSFWFEAEAELKSGKIVKSSGLKDNTNKGISPKVFRVSYWDNDDYLGYLTTFFNVPGIFGSMPYQSTNYIGVDCADVLVAASAVMHNKKKVKNYNVMMLVDKFKTKVKLKIDNGTPSQKLKWGTDFQRGDFIAVKYRENGRYAHIGLLYEDTNHNGFLDKYDNIMNAGPNALHLTALKKGAFNGTVVILDNSDMD